MCFLLLFKCLFLFRIYIKMFSSVNICADWVVFNVDHQRTMMSYFVKSQGSYSIESNLGRCEQEKERKGEKEREETSTSHQSALEFFFLLLYHNDSVVTFVYFVIFFILRSCVSCFCYGKEKRFFLKSQLERWGHWKVKLNKKKGAVGDQLCLGWIIFRFSFNRIIHINKSVLFIYIAWDKCFPFSYFFSIPFFLLTSIIFSIYNRWKLKSYYKTNDIIQLLRK